MMYLSGTFYFIAGCIIGTVSLLVAAFIFVSRSKKVAVYTPPTKRSSPVKNPVIPASDPHFYSLISKPVSDLRDMGFGIWDNMPDIVKDNKAYPSKVTDRPVVWDGPKDTVIVLFPGEWYPKIPVGFVCTGLYGQEFCFSPDSCSNETRMGCLAYGIKKQLGER